MAFIICAIGALYLLRVPILTRVGTFLIVQDPLEPADIIFVLNGDIATRPFQVAKLVNQGISDKVVIVRAGDSLAVDAGLQPNITEMSVAMMKRAGIPEAKIVQLPFPKGVTSTFDEAAALHAYAKENAVKRIVVVTSAIHTRRARWILTRKLADLPLKIMMSPAPDPRYTPGNWWLQEDGFIGCQNEYLKQAGELSGQVPVTANVVGARGPVYTPSRPFYQHTERLKPHATFRVDPSGVRLSCESPPASVDPRSYSDLLVMPDAQGKVIGKRQASPH